MLRWLAVQVIVVGLNKAYSHLPYNPYPDNSKAVRLPIHVCQKMVLAQQILKGSSRLLSLAKIKKSLKQPPNLRKPALQNSEPS